MGFYHCVHLGQYIINVYVVLKFGILLHINLNGEISQSRPIALQRYYINVTWLKTAYKQCIN